MLKVVQLLNRYRSFVLAFLFLPILSFLGPGFYTLQDFPEFPFPTYRLEFVVPHRAAEEIENRVTGPSEKMLNGLPGLLSLESKTEDHLAQITVIFKEGISPENAYLYLQERLDRVKLTLPRDVESIRVDRILASDTPDLRVVFATPVSVGVLGQLLKEFRSQISNSVPTLQEGASIAVALDQKKMLAEGITVSHIAEALKLAGVSTQIGENGGLLFSIGHPYRDVEELRATLVGIKGGARPIRLADVATLEVRPRSGESVTSQLELWLPKKGFDSAQKQEPDRPLDRMIQEKLFSKYPEAKVSRPLQDHLRRSLRSFFSYTAFFFFLASLASKLVLGRKFPLRFLLVFNGLILLHYFFWRQLSASHVYSTDLLACLLLLGIGNAFFLMTLNRIQGHMSPVSPFLESPRSIEQATLFTLAECVPVFLVVLLLFALSALPLLLTSVHLPSRYLVQGLIFVGFVVLLICVVIVPVLGDTRWLKATPLRHSGKDWRHLLRVEIEKLLSTQILSRKGKGLHLFFLLLLAAIQFHLFERLPFSSESFFGPVLSRPAETPLESARGYGSRLRFLVEQSGMKGGGAVCPMQSKSKPYQIWTFTPSGLRFLPDLDLISFSSAMDQIERGGYLGRLTGGSEGSSVPISFSKELNLDHSIGNLTLKSKVKGASPQLLRILTEPRLELHRSTILRSRLIDGSLCQLPPEERFNNLKLPLPAATPTQWTSHLLTQFREFHGTQWVVGAFSFLILAIYLNSFVRSFLILVFGMALLGANTLLYSLRSSGFPIDGIWSFSLVPWVALCAAILIYRLTDMERSRGFDREMAFFETLRQHGFCIFVSASLCLVSIGSLSLFTQADGILEAMTSESLLSSLVYLLLLMLLFRYWMSSLYLDAEEAVEEAAFALFRLPALRRWVRRL